MEVGGFAEPRKILCKCALASDEQISVHPRSAHGEPESPNKGEVLSMKKDPTASKYTWKIVNFSKLDEKRQESQIFSTGDHQWYCYFIILICNLN